MAGQAVHRVVYRSKAVKPMSAEDLQALLEQARARNRAAGITGLLLYKPQEFVQAVEGPAPAVAALMKRIYNDERHVKIRVLLEEVETPRLFADWGMAFLAPDEDGALQPGGAGRFYQTQNLSPGALQSAKLLAGFFKDAAQTLAAPVNRARQAG